MQIECFDKLTIAKDSSAVTMLDHLFKAMRNENDGDAFFAQSLEQPKEQGRFLFGECSGWLIQYQDARVVRQDFRDLDKLLLSQGQRTHPNAHIDMFDSQTSQNFPRLLDIRLLIDHEPLTRFASTIKIIG